MNTLLAINKLAVGYDKTNPENALISAFTTKVKAGERIAIMGLNGSGKSTLLKTISGELDALSGNVFFGNREMSSLQANERSRLVSTVFTRYQNPGQLTVDEVISFGRYPYTNTFNKLDVNDKQRIENAIELAGIKNLINRQVSELSDGERQKVMLAVAIAQDTPVLILDEPASHLDIRNKILVMDLIRKLGIEENKILLFSTHDIGIALEVADRVWLLNNKKISDFDIESFKIEKPWKIMLEGIDASRYLNY